MGYLNAKYSEMDSKEGVFAGGLVDNLEPEKLNGKNAQILYNARINGKGTARRAGSRVLIATTGTTLLPGMFGFAYQGNTYLYFGVAESGTTGQVRYQRYCIETGVIENITHTTGSWFGGNGQVVNGAVQSGEVALHLSSGNGRYQTSSTKVIDLSTVGVQSNVNSSNQVVFDGLFWGGYGYNLAYGTTPFVVSATIVMGELVTGIACNSQQLFAFTRTTISAVSKTGELTSYLANTLQALEGSVSRLGVVTAGDRIFYWTPSNKVNEIGRDSVAGFQTRDLSHRKYNGIDTFMATLDPDQTGVVGWYIPQLNLVKWACKSKGNAYNNLVLCYNLDNDSFSIDTNRYITSAYHFNGRTYCTDYFGGLNVMEDEVDDDDNGFAIPFIRRSKIFAFGDLSLRKQLWEARTTATLTGPSTIDQKIYLDGNLWRTDTMINDITINNVNGGMATSPFGAEPVGGGGYPTGDTKTQNFVVSKSKLQKKIYKMEVEWTCNTLGGNFLLQDFKAKVEGLREETSDNSF